MFSCSQIVDDFSTSSTRYQFIVCLILSVLSHPSSSSGALSAPSDHTTTTNPHDMLLLSEMPSASSNLPSTSRYQPMDTTYSTLTDLLPTTVSLSIPTSLPTVLSTSFLATVAAQQPSLFTSLMPSLSLPTTVPSQPTVSSSFTPIVPTTVSEVKSTVSTPPSTVVRDRRVFDEKCVVCGDRATGLHYSVPSCNGCKTFFRRTIICGRQFKCHKNGKCQFNKQGRCSCRACRFQKCLDSGMDPHAIQHSRHNPYPLISTTSTGDSVNKEVPSSVYPTKDLGELLSETLGRPDSPLSTCNLSSPGVSPIPSCLDVKPILPYIDNEELRELVSREIKMYGLRRNGSYRGGALLDILTKPPAIENRDTLVDLGITPIFMDDESRCGYFLNYELSISIEYAKTHSVFRNLSFCDKCVLIEDVSIALFVLTSAYEAYFKDSKVLSFSNGDEVKFADENGNPSDLIECLSRCHLDPATFALTKALTFLNPEAYGLSPEGRSSINAERDRHMRMLAQFTLQRFGQHGAAILGESFLLPSTTLAFGRRIRSKPPADAPLLYITSPMPIKKEIIS